MYVKIGEVIYDSHEQLISIGLSLAERKFMIDRCAKDNVITASPVGTSKEATLEFNTELFKKVKGNVK
jgi:hypothetical protein